MSASLGDKVVLVTGAAGGIGCAVAAEAAARGAVTAWADLDLAAVRAKAARLPSAGAPPRCYTIDVSDPEACTDLVTEVVDELGRIDVLLNAAGVIGSVPLLEVTPEAWEREMGVNARGSLALTQAVARHFIDYSIEGSIVHVASVGGRSGRPFNAVYAASKAAVINLTQSAALALAEHGIRVNSVAPGVIATPMTTSLHKERSALRGMSVEESLAEMTAAIPLGRVGEPDEVAAAMLFLASDEARYVTGQCLNVCGGMDLR